MPTEIEFFLWWITDEVTGKRRRTSFKMDRATALERYPGAEPHELSREIREVLLPGEDPPPHWRRPTLG